MSSTRHAVILGPSLTGFGYRPELTPAHQVDLLIGIGPRGASMSLSRTKPLSGRPSLNATTILHRLLQEDKRPDEPALYAT